MSFAERIFLEVWASEGIFVSDRRLREWLGIGKCFEKSGLVFPKAITEYVKSFIDWTELKSNLGCGNWFSLRREALAGQEDLSTRLGHAGVQRGLAQLIWDKLPKADLVKQTGAAIVWEEAQDAHGEAAAFPILEDLV